MTDPIRRRAEIETNLAAVRGQIAEAARAVGRDPDEVTLVVVTKTWPASDIAVLVELGVRDIGENRHQEAEEKASALADLTARSGLRWHFIGQIQSNKAPRIAHYADVVHSVDSVRAAHRLNSGAHAADRVIDALVQVSLDPDPGAAGRGGVRPDDVDEIAHAIDTAGGLRLGGVMGVAPLGADSAAAYALLRDASHRLQATYPSATWVSGGMSGDFRSAIEAGATHVRVGSAVLGERPALG